MPLLLLGCVWGGCNRAVTRDGLGGGVVDAGIRRLQACVLVANDADIAGYTLGEVQEATETIIASPDEPSIPKLRRMFQAALAKAAAARQQAQFMGANPGALAAAAAVMAAAVAAQGVDSAGVGGGANPSLQTMFAASHGSLGGNRTMGGQGAAGMYGGMQGGRGRGGSRAFQPGQGPNDGPCNLCGQKGHWRRDCPMGQAGQAMGQGPAIGANAVPVGGMPLLLPPPAR